MERVLRYAHFEEGMIMLNGKNIKYYKKWKNWTIRAIEGKLSLGSGIEACLGVQAFYNEPVYLKRKILWGKRGAEICKSNCICISYCCI